MREWLPEEHLAYFINDTVDSLDMQAFHARYARRGSRNQPFHPAVMVKMLIYGYATGCFSSRKLARKLHEDVAFRLLGVGSAMQSRRICSRAASLSPWRLQTLIADLSRSAAVLSAPQRYRPALRT